MKKRIIESVKDCKLVKEGADENGHDCWGKLEWSSYQYVTIDNKETRVHDEMFIVHNGETVEAAIYKWELDKYKTKEVKPVNQLDYLPAAIPFGFTIKQTSEPVKEQKEQLYTEREL